MHFENLLFILLIAMAALLRLLATKAGEAKKRPQKADQGRTITPKIGESIRRARVESDEERIRKFLEALGQPTTAKSAASRCRCKRLSFAPEIVVSQFASPAWRNWQTRWTQNPVIARSCGFEPLRRQFQRQ